MPSQGHPMSTARTLPVWPPLEQATRDWFDTLPQGTQDVVVVGAGIAGLTTALCYSARPDPSYDPNKCIFEVATLELFPKGQEPQTEWEYTPKDSPKWLSVLPQDFSNMAAVQQGMKSLGFPGTKPNPYRERSTVNLHTQLAKYMGTGEPQELGDK